MSETAPETSGGHGFMTGKVFGMPMWVWLVVVGVAGYWYFSRKAGGGSMGGAGTTTGGGGQVTTGATTVSPGAVKISVSQTGGQGSVNGGKKPPIPIPIPFPPYKPPPRTRQDTQHTVTVVPWTAQNTPWNSTMSGIAQHEGISLQELEAMNPQVSNPNLIYPGQKINIP